MSGLADGTVGMILCSSPLLFPGDLMSWLKTFTLPIEVISVAVETLYHYGSCEDIKQTQVGDLSA